MAVKYAQGGGGGFWDSVFPKALSLGGMALGGPVGGLVGNFAGNLASGQSLGQAAGNTAAVGVNQWSNGDWAERMSEWRDRRGW